MKSRRRSQNPQFPSHIIETILSKLSFFILLNLRPVCKAWNNLILTSKLLNLNSKANLFAHITPYQKLYCIDFDSKILKEGKKNCIVRSFTFHPRFFTFKMVNSCNGLFCFVNTEMISDQCEKKSFGLKQPLAIILNPMTNEELSLNNSLKFYPGSSFGFGYSPNKKQYKIVKLSLIKIPHLRSSYVASHLRSSYVAEIFTIGKFARGRHGKWRQNRVPAVRVLWSFGVYLNGSLYWKAYNTTRIRANAVLLRFDVEDEKFEVVSFPQVVRDDAFLISSNIWIFNNTLYVSYFDSKIDMGSFHVWKMMEEDYSWVKLEQKFAIMKSIKDHFSLMMVSYIRDYMIRCHFQLIKVFEDETMLFLISQRALILYDSKIDQFEAVHDELNQDQDGKLCIHEIDSLNFDSLAKTLGVN
ncbi:hypothetical protein Csa_001357 [Cucumis sativus]|uniref:F-box domain-containing protein n=1 Tax=Cucumis sativus TaxID=3659 RepID=A0A0A0LCZ3_CUCSA|nr:hypothetical protein Csa_001357 [Cucumis sativus]